MSSVIKTLADQAVRIQQLEGHLATANDARLRVLAGWIAEALPVLHTLADDLESTDEAEALERLISTGTALVDNVVCRAPSGGPILGSVELRNAKLTGSGTESG